MAKEPSVHERWLQNIRAHRWTHGVTQTHATSLRCAICYSQFVPPHGKLDTLTDEHNNIRLQVCPTCANSHRTIH